MSISRIAICLVGLSLVMHAAPARAAEGAHVKEVRERAHGKFRFNIHDVYHYRWRQAKDRWAGRFKAVGNGLLTVGKAMSKPTRLVAAISIPTAIAVFVPESKPWVAKQFGLLLEHLQPAVTFFKDTWGYWATGGGGLLGGSLLTGFFHLESDGRDAKMVQHYAEELHKQGVEGTLSTIAEEGLELHKAEKKAPK